MTPMSADHNEQRRRTRNIQSEYNNLLSWLLGSCYRFNGNSEGDQRSNQDQRRRKLTSLDIGLPTDFRHTCHLGTNDHVDMIDLRLKSSLEEQMKSKGGYDNPSPSKIPMESMY